MGGGACLRSTARPLLFSCTQRVKKYGRRNPLPSRHDAVPHHLHIGGKKEEEEEDYANKTLIESAVRVTVD